jgi:hypothetical protein
VEVLPMTNTNYQLEIGNTGSGNTSTLATLNNIPTLLRFFGSDTPENADFPSLRKRGCIYVDKTMYMHRLIAPKRARCGLSVFHSIPKRASWLISA